MDNDKIDDKKIINEIDNNKETENKYDSSIISTKKLTGNKWNMIDKPLSETERKRNEIILKLGEEVSSITNELSKSNIYTISDYYYRIVKNELKNLIDFNNQTNINNQSNINNIASINYQLQKNYKNK